MLLKRDIWSSRNVADKDSYFTGCYVMSIGKQLHDNANVNENMLALRAVPLYKSCDNITQNYDFRGKRTLM